jgi:RAB protein geranylgeranyltransferase component A
MLIKVYFMADYLEQMRGLNDKLRNSLDWILLYDHSIERLNNFRFIPLMNLGA